MVILTDEQAIEYILTSRDLREAATKIKAERDKYKAWWNSAREEAALAGKAMEKAFSLVEERNREIAAWKERESYQAQQRDMLYAERCWVAQLTEVPGSVADKLRRENAELQNKLDDFKLMADDYLAHRGSFGGTGVAVEIDKILDGHGYTQAKG